MNFCSICNRNFATSDLLQSSQDEYFCKECFKYEYCTTRQQRCGSGKKKPIVGNKCNGDSLMKAKKMFTLAELSTIRNGRERTEELISKRPLQCPHVDCNKYVSVVDLNAHFEHEHMDVRNIQTTVNTRNPLTFFPKDIRYGVNQCLLLLNVLPAPEALGSDATASQAETTVKAPVTVAVLASRLASAQLERDSTVDCFLDDEDQTGLILSSNDKIIIWTASNVICNYSYTVAVSTVTEDIRVKYYGPLLQIGQTAKDLCLEGHCLTLAHFHFLGMSELGTKPLHLDVMVHSED